MRNHYTTKEGDILPFHQIIRVMRMSEIVRIMFVNGCVDIEKEEVEEFLMAYEGWLDRPNEVVYTQTV